MNIHVGTNLSYGVPERDDEPVYNNTIDLKDQQVETVVEFGEKFISVKRLKCLQGVIVVVSILAVIALLIAIGSLAMTATLLTKSESDEGEANAHNQNDSTNGISSATTNPLFPIGTQQNPANSCRDLPQDHPSGEYYIRPSQSGSPIVVYCDMNPRKCVCNGTSSGGWMRVAFLDLSDTAHECSDGFDTVLHEEQRFCYRQEREGCGSAIYSTHGIEYSQVCGRVTAYQQGLTSAFLGYSQGGQLTLEGVYVDGVSVTYGEPPRQHIWTFAGAVNEMQSGDRSCPCIGTNTEITGTVPPFIAQDYFCDTAVRGSTTSSQFIYLANPLWDGLGCGSTSTCCTFNAPPWFCKQLPEPTTDDIEIRICNYVSGPLISALEMNIK